MGTIAKVNNILCGNISKIDNILKANASKLDNNIFCPVTPTPTVTRGGTPTPTPSVTFTQTPTVTRTQTPAVTQTPTNTITPTPIITESPTGTPSVTPTPTRTPEACPKDCCFVQLCYSSKNCQDACLCNEPVNVYLTVCVGDNCELSAAYGIYEEDSCTNPAISGYYSNGVICYYWDGVSTLSFNSNC